MAAPDPPRRPRPPDPRRTDTRQRILAAAGDLFRTHGIDGVGVDAVMRQAGLTHGGFYLHFPSKEALAAEVSQFLLEKSAASWDEISRHPDREAALQRIVRPYLDPAQLVRPHGCALATMGSDVARRAGSKHAINDSLRRMLDALGRVLPGRRRRSALTALSTMVGAVVLARLADDPALAEAFLAEAEASLLPPNRPKVLRNPRSQ